LTVERLWTLKLLHLKEAVGMIVVAQIIRQRVRPPHPAMVISAATVRQIKAHLTIQKAYLMDATTVNCPVSRKGRINPQVIVIVTLIIRVRTDSQIIHLICFVTFVMLHIYKRRFYDYHQSGRHNQ
jgi:hypothetical protein